VGRPKKENSCIVEGLVYEFPPQPPLSEIRNYGLPRIQQIWTRYLDYEKFDWSDGWEARATPEQIKYLEEEIERLYTGCWIIIDGKPTYLNNYMYFFMQWMLLENEYYAQYRDSSLYYFRFVEICEKTKLCLGHTLIKGRRLGASSMEASIELLNGLIHRNSRQGIISKTGDDARDIFEFIVIAFQALPPFLKPSIEGSDAPKKILSIKKQAGRITKDNTQGNSREGLNNTIQWKSTALNSFDSGKLLRILVDESGKWDEVDIVSYLQIVGKCLTKGASVTGKMAVVTTVNRGDKGGDRFKIVWDSSDQSKVNRLGQTASGLYRIMIPAYMGYEGYLDFFGNSVIENPTPEQTKYLKTLDSCPDPTIGAKTYLELQRKSKENDPEALMEEIRQAPFDAVEVFKTANNLCHFNVFDIEAQLERVYSAIEKMGRNPNISENGRKGWFVKGNDGKVVWKDDEKNGMWHVIKFLPPGEDNKFTYRDGIKCPDNTAFGGAGLDTFANAQQTVEKGSDAACTIRERYHSMNPDDSGLPVAFFIGRPKTKREFHDQIFNGIQYYGCKILIERSPTDWEDYAIEQKLASPLDRKKRFGYLATTKRADGSEVYGISAQDKQAREEHLTEMVEDGLNNTHKIWFKRILKDRLKFNINDRLLYDGSVSDGYALMCLKENTQKVEPRKHTEQIIKTYKLVS